MKTLIRTFGRLVQRHGRQLAVLMLALVIGNSAVLAEEAGFYHKYMMRGQVLEVDNQTVVLCIGSADGAEVGQELDVVRHVRSKTPPKATGPGFMREEVGKVKITKVFDEHYAEATVLDGNVRQNDIVELAAH